MATRRPDAPWWNVTVGTAAYTFPKSATTEPLASRVSETARTGCSTIRVRTGMRWVQGATPAGPSTVAATQLRSSNPGWSHPSGAWAPSMFSVKST